MRIEWFQRLPSTTTTLSLPHFAYVVYIDHLQFNMPAQADVTETTAAARKPAGATLPKPAARQPVHPYTPPTQVANTDDVESDEAISSEVRDLIYDSNNCSHSVDRMMTMRVTRVAITKGKRLQGYHQSTCSLCIAIIPSPFKLTAESFTEWPY